MLRPGELARRLAVSDGEPDIAGLPCDRIIATDGSEIMYRFHLAEGRRAIRFHHLMASDPGRDFHDHPWDFTSRLLSGMYIEHTLQGTIVYRAPCVIGRRAEQLHRLELPEGPVWSYVVTGRPRRRWGFQTAEYGWVAWQEYPAAGQYAPCGDEDGRSW